MPVCSHSLSSAALPYFYRWTPGHRSLRFHHSTMSTSPWDIYAEQLFSLGYGYPLWIPEPNQHEVDIGDVGWIQDGEFCTLLNTRKPEDSPVNIDKGVPPHFDMFCPPNSHIYARQGIMPKMVCSPGIRAMDAVTKVGAAT